MALKAIAAAILIAAGSATGAHASALDNWSALFRQAYGFAVDCSEAAVKLNPPAQEAQTNALDTWSALFRQAYGFMLDFSEAAAKLNPPVPQKAEQPGAEETGDPALRALIAEASHRFDVPEPWIRAVMRIESDGDPSATSPKGAMGLMQVMPQTYAYLSDRYGLGKDPYALRDNVFAGSAYLREMYDRYGSAGFIAAYNAGPGRYEDCLTSGRSLPYETQRYVASVRLALGEALFGKPNAPFYEPLAIAPNGELLLGTTGEKLPVADRLALHTLVQRAAKRAAAAK